MHDAPLLEQIIQTPELWSDAKSAAFAAHLGRDQSEVQNALFGGSFPQYVTQLRDRYEGADQGIVDDAIRLAFADDLNIRPQIRSQELARLLAREHAAAAMRPRQEQLSLFKSWLGRIVAKATQIKAAAWHRETFDPANPDMAKAQAGTLLRKLYRERELINRDLFYLDEEDWPVAVGSGLESTMRERRRDLTRRLHEVTADIDQERRA